MVAEELLEVVVLRLLDAVLEDLLEHGVLHLQRRAELEVVGLFRGVQSLEHRSSWLDLRLSQPPGYPSPRQRFRDVRQRTAETSALDYDSVSDERSSVRASVSARAAFCSSCSSAVASIPSLRGCSKANISTMMSGSNMICDW